MKYKKIILYAILILLILTVLVVYLERPSKYRTVNPLFKINDTEYLITNEEIDSIYCGELLGAIKNKTIRVKENFDSNQLEKGTKIFACINKDIKFENCLLVYYKNKYCVARKIFK